MSGSAILFVTTEKTDYLQDLTYAGLVERLGKARVHDLPRHWQYHKARRHFWKPAKPYPHDIGRSPGAPAGPTDEAAARTRIEKGEYGLLVLGACKPDALAAFEAVIDSTRAPWVFLDGGDWADIGGDFRRLGGAECFERFRSLARRRPPAFVLKREVPLGAATADVIPFPMCIHPERATVLSWSEQKEFDVVFWGVESSPVRKRAFDLLRGRFDCDRNGTVPGQVARKYSLTGAAYFRALNRTRVALSFGGAGFDTLRYWEIPAAGALMLSERPTIEIPDDFVHGRDVVFCDNDLADLLPTIEYHLRHPDEARGMAQSGQDHLLAHHTHRHRADLLLNLLESRDVWRA